MRAGNQLSDASATPVGKVPECHARSTISKKCLVDVALVRILVADELRHAVETLCFILTKVEYERDQGRKDGAVAHVWEVTAKAYKDLFNRIHACFVETVSEKKERKQGAHWSE